MVKEAVTEVVALIFESFLIRYQVIIVHSMKGPSEVLSLVVYWYHEDHHCITQRSGQQDLTE